MLWALVLAHFLADFPLQPDWMVKAKFRFRVLLLHVGTHLVVSSLLVGLTTLRAWPYLILLAAIHLAIDIAKNEVWRRWPAWVVVPFIIDQFLHFLSLYWVASLVERSGLPVRLPLPEPWFIYAIGYLFVTYVWFITERILVHANQNYRQEVIHQSWSRMIARALLLSIFLWTAGLFSTSPAALTTVAAGNIAAGAVLPLPYISGKRAVRAFLTDLAVVLGMVAFILWAG